MSDWILAMAMIDRFDGLTISAAKEMIKLQKTRKPPCANFAAIHRVIEGVVREALTRQRRMLLEGSKN